MFFLIRMMMVYTKNREATPPIVTVSLKIKTVVNEKTQKSEVVSASAVCHNNVLLDTGLDESPKQMTQLSMIRPIRMDGTSIGNSLLQFPRDVDGEIRQSMSQLQKMPNERSLLNRLFTQIGLWDPDVITGHSLYPSTIQEYNLWKIQQGQNDKSSTADVLPPIPDESLDVGVLPLVIKALVHKQKIVKQILKKKRILINTKN